MQNVNLKAWNTFWRLASAMDVSFGLRSRPGSCPARPMPVSGGRPAEVLPGCFPICQDVMRQAESCPAEDSAGRDCPGGAVRTHGIRRDSRQVDDVADYAEIIGILRHGSIPDLEMAASLVDGFPDGTSASCSRTGTAARCCTPASDPSALTGMMFSRTRRRHILQRPSQPRR